MPYSIVHIFRDEEIMKDRTETTELIITTKEQLCEHTREKLAEFAMHDVIAFNEEDYECIFFMRFNRKTKECKIEFNQGYCDDDYFLDVEDIIESCVLLCDEEV